MKNIIAALLIGGLSFPSFASKTETIRTGGVSQEVQNSIQYPTEAKERKVEATVWVEFSIDATGHVGEIKALTDHGHGLEKEVVSAIKKLDGKSVMQEGKYRVPVKFEIR